jgi:hypothetical protein
MGPQPALSAGVIRLETPVPGFPTALAAHRLNWSRKVIVPPGQYTIESTRLNEGDSHDNARSNGYYYQLAGAHGVVWVRQNYLIAAKCKDWPFDLTGELEPCDWDQLWREYYRDKWESTGGEG